MDDYVEMIQTLTQDKEKTQVGIVSLVIDVQFYTRSL